MREQHKLTAGRTSEVSGGWAPALGKKAAGKVPELEGGSPPPATSPSYPSRSRTPKESLFEVQVFQAHSVLSLAPKIT